MTQAIYKTRNTGTGNGMLGMFVRFWEVSQKMSGGTTSLTLQRVFKKISDNTQEDSGECLRKNGYHIYVTLEIRA